MGSVCGSGQDTSEGKPTTRKQGGTMDTANVDSESRVESSSDSAGYDPSDATNANVCDQCLLTVLCVCCCGLV